MRHYLAIAAALSLSACSSLFPEKEAPRLFALSVPRNAAPTAAAALPLSLQVALPQAGPGLDSERIALKLEGQEVSYFDNAKWSGPLPRLVQAQLVDAIEQQRIVASVGSDLVPFRADYALAVELRDFQAEYANGTPRAHVRFTARLIDTETYNVVATLPYEEVEPASANRLLDVVGAHNAAFVRATQRMTQDIATMLAQRQPQPPAPPVQ